MHVHNSNLYDLNLRNMNLNFISADNSNIDTLIELMQELYEFYRLSFNPSIASKALSTLLGNASLGRVWLVTYNNEAIAYVVLTFLYSLEYQGRVGFIDELYVRESHRGQGVGTKILNFIEEICLSLAIQVILLEVDGSNSRIQDFYRLKVGFKNTNRTLMVRHLCGIH